jgi:HEPN domain-containing protein
MKPETENWIGMAKEDYHSSLYLFKGAHHPQAVYYLCQAIEKVLKAAQMEYLDQYPKKIHNLKTLGEQSGLSLSAEQMNSLENLTTHYNRVRYRDIGDTSYNTKAKVEPIFKQGQEMYLWILNTLDNH